MTPIQRTIAATALALSAGCGHTINYTVGTPDPSPPAMDLLIKRNGAADLEVGNLNGPSAKVAANLGALPASPGAKVDFSVLATATDNDSGIAFIKLSLTRTVCSNGTGGVVGQAYSGTVTRKQATFTDPSKAPTQVSEGDTGIFDNTTAAVATPTDDNLLVWTNANGVKNVGIGVSARWNFEAKNFAGATSYSDSITMAIGDVSCVTTP